MNEQEDENQREAQEAKQEEEAKPTSPAPKVRKKPWKILAKIFGSTLVLGLLAAWILDQFQVPHRFSIETTAREINFETESTAEANPFQLTTQPYLKTLSVSANTLNITTSEFVIQETNEPKLRGDIKAQVLKAKSKKSTYYLIQNIESIRIPTEIYFQSNKNEGKVRFEFKGKKDADENILTVHLPPGKTTLELKTKETNLLIHESKIEYGNKPISTNGRRIRIKGKPHKISIEMQSSEQGSVTLYTEKGKAYNLKLTPNPPVLATKIRFLQTSPKTKIYRYPREPLPIKEKFPSNSNINITGTIEQISNLDITDQGIYTTILGEYVIVEIGESEEENTRLDEAIDWLQKANIFRGLLKGSSD